ncbi:MAG: SH3 domain-containing protein [Pirellulaceae bacterium]
MRGVTACFLWCGVLGTIVRGAEPTFPYQAEVAVDEVEVRCGPGWDYYPTQRLRRGSAVEVYRHDPGGWLAIRPPQGSFSWMTARHLTRTSERSVAEVALEGAVAWVGATQTGIVQHKWQVRLEQGERVEVLGEEAMTVGPGFATETYCRIAPPAGEFRWIHAEQAVSSPRADNASIVPTQTSPPRSVGGPSAPDNRDLSTGIARGDDTAPELAKKIEELKIELSLLVTEQIEQWDLESLQQRADALAQQAASPTTARELKGISQRIAEFQTLQRRHQKARQPAAGDDPEQINKHSISGVSQTFSHDQQPEVSPAVSVEATPASGDSKGTRCDAEGWLMPVHSTKRVAPPFAVLDDDGRVRAYVTPTPGLNLRRYTKKYVGLVGDQRYVSTLRAPHITAERVVKIMTNDE